MEHLRNPYENKDKRIGIARFAELIFYFNFLISLDECFVY